jgi:voltage-gated potassium channel Kch
MPQTTPGDYWQKMRQERIDAFMPHDSDGPFLVLPRAPAHAFVLTFLAYVHALFAFAIMYLGESSWLEDPFRSSPGLWAGVFDALYFSVVTITTLGYGDLSPQVWLGKLLVMFEGFSGLVLIVVAIQRVIAGFEEPADGAQDEESNDGENPRETC